jgi:pimeloyl-ACP methyl ester carboxylesterase
LGRREAGKIDRNADVRQDWWVEHVGHSHTFAAQLCLGESSAYDLPGVLGLVDSGEDHHEVSICSDPPTWHIPVSLGRAEGHLRRVTFTALAVSAVAFGSVAPMTVDRQQLDFVEAGGRRMEYTTHGTDRPEIVFLHEGIGSVALWRDLPAEVCRLSGMTGLVYSRRGHGWSDPPPGPHHPRYLHEEALDVLPAVLAEFEVGPPVLVGHSDGASIALIHAAAGFPVRALVLIAPHAFVEDGALEAMGVIGARFDDGDLADRMATYHRDPTRTFQVWHRIWTDHRFRMWNIEDGLERIEAPMLLVQARDDEYGTMEQLDRIAARVAGPITRLEFDTGGHSPHLTRTDEVAAMTAAFVTSSTGSEVAS